MTTYRIFITPKNIAFPTIWNLLLGDSSSGMLITSDIFSDVWVSHYTSCFCLMSGEPLNMCTTYQYPDLVLGYMRAHVWNLKLS